MVGSGAMLGGTAGAQGVLNLSLATATPGGGFPAYGEAFAAAIGATDPTIIVSPRNTAGSLENVTLLAEGRVDLGLAAGETATAALARGAGITVAAAMYATPGLFGVLPSSPARGIDDLRGKRVAWGARGSNFLVLARQVMTGLGLDLDRDFEGVLLDRAGDGPAMVLDGRVAALWGGGAGWPGFVTLAGSPAGLRFIAPDAGERGRIVAASPALREMALPARSYAGQDAAIASVGVWSFVLARPGLDEDAGYRLARALHRGVNELARRLPQASESTAQNMIAAAPRVEAIHPGVRRFLRDEALLG
ncbi:TAXI family TRAP transporter solute-binding subunit [Plastoroseomonas arctica]|nr:TAXI family TRAP transporter solute-binding subunit [Plastoroseomonas arctica]